MTSQLGELIGQGATAEVFAWGEGRVLKLARPGVERVAVEYEANTTRTAFESGAPAPQVFEVIEIEGRLGIVYPRYSGETVLGKLGRGAVTPAEAARTLASVHHSLHFGNHRGDLVTFERWVNFSLGRLEEKGCAPDVLPIVRDWLAKVPADGPVCHGDLHLDNIMITADGPVILDWISALAADPMVDIARQHLSLTVLPIEDERAKRFDAIRPEIDAVFLETYAEISGTTVPALLSAIAPFMPIMAALRMSEPVCTPLETEILTALIRDSVR